MRGAQNPRVEGSIPSGPTRKVALTCMNAQAMRMLFCPDRLEWHGNGTETNQSCRTFSRPLSMSASPRVSVALSHRSSATLR